MDGSGRQETVAKASVTKVYRATWSNFEAFGLGKIQAREACRLGVKMVINRTGRKIKVPTDDDIEIETLQYGKPRQKGKYL